ncbi:MAG: hypothetical protein B0D92_02335 [Spirochaeta sp. LUC14_002_19_P3]|nr:MAG: hypothetical protein B0D92_02335 [Spirochaeta sp. LUC14_002_19_P3]
MNRIIPAVLLFCILPKLSAQQEDALLYYRQGQYQDAVRVCLKELRDKNHNQTRRRMDSYSVLGWSYLRLGQYENALNSAREARQELRYDVRIIEIEGEALYYLGRHTEALSLFEEYVSLTTRAQGDRIDTVYYFMGEIFLRLAEYQHADIAFSAALHYNPQAAQWWARLGYVREQIPNTQGAKTAYTKALELMPTLEDARAGLDRLGQ